MLYLDACQKICGGCPATQEIPCGVETGATNITSPELDDSADNVSVASLSSSEEDVPTTPQTPRAQIVDKTAVNRRRNLLDGKLDSFKQDGLKRKIPVDSQFLSLAQDDLALKKKFMERMDKVDSVQEKTMESLMQSMAKTTEAITAGFGMLQNLLAQLAAPPYTQNPPVYPSASPLAAVATMPPASSSFHAHQYQQPMMGHPAWYPPTGPAGAVGFQSAQSDSSYSQ